MVIALILCAYAGAYLARARSLARRGRPVPTWRSACFLAGLIVLGLAVSAPVGRLARSRFAAHMAEHLLIGDVAPLLLVLGLTGALVAPVLRIRAMERLRVLTHPVPAILLWGANLMLWHLPVAY